MRATLRILGTLVVTALLTYPLWAPQWGAGVLGEILIVPFPGNLAIVVGFFALVALYCGALHRLARRVGMARPASVWWMFAIPYNFIEDFFIIERVGAALGDHASAGVTRAWRRLGYGWCAAQLVSLLPGKVGLLGGMLAIVLWVVHWALTATTMRRLG
ncbi:hypothetical protein G7070_06425 [Propioniciclava coleopterorum]|uniref:Uncharacterized protein n=1 Tax=Propioniciclava coleopterorum TaxID=2714937 RepID=A0A6G7Y577_9ACTN|nr:hypothetical protein [Propioniciclava coleopterorum]QIK71965.1 hypothetical protein G7070_06425 [Propioniciclava coleopterorum]